MDDNDNNIIRLKDGSEIYYRQFGEGKPLFLLHGNDGDMTYFEYQIGFLSKYFHLYLIDFRDHGYSTNTKDYLSFEMMANDLNFIFDSLGVSKAHIIGFSDGANLALVFHKLYASRIDKLVLNAPNARFDGITMPAKILMILENILWRILPFFKRNKRVAKLLLSDLKLDRNDLRNIDNPTCIIVGSRDVIRLSHIRGIAQNIRNSKLYIIKNQGHKLARTAPEIFNKIIYDFLRGE